jgi:hypothetical protein
LFFNPAISGNAGSIKLPLVGTVTAETGELANRKNAYIAGKFDLNGYTYKLVVTATPESLSKDHQYVPGWFVRALHTCKADPNKAVPTMRAVELFTATVYAPGVPESYKFADVQFTMLALVVDLSSTLVLAEQSKDLVNYKLIHAPADGAGGPSSSSTAGSAAIFASPALPNRSAPRPKGTPPSSRTLRSSTPTGRGVSPKPVAKTESPKPAAKAASPKPAAKAASPKLAAQSASPKPKQLLQVVNMLEMTRGTFEGPEFNKYEEKPKKSSTDAAVVDIFAKAGLSHLKR